MSMRLPVSSAAKPGHGRTAVAGVVIGIAGGLLAFAPARWVSATVQGNSAQRVELANARGTLWNGSAQLVISGGSGSQDAVALPGTVHWRLSPAWGGITADVMAECCTPQPLHVHISPTGWGGMRVQVDDAQSSWPASLLSGLGTPWNTVQPQGQLVASTQGLSLELTAGRVQMAGRLQVDANRISSRLSTLQPMGSYRVTVAGGNVTSLQLETLEGSLQLTGTRQWLDQRLHFEGAASAPPDRIEALSNLLNILGRRDGARSLIKVG